jgi:hypothetical protein
MPKQKNGTLNPNSPNFTPPAPIRAPHNSPAADTFLTPIAPPSWPLTTGTLPAYTGAPHTSLAAASTPPAPPMHRGTPHPGSSQQFQGPHGSTAIEAADIVEAAGLVERRELPETEEDDINAFLDSGLQEMREEDENAKREEEAKRHRQEQEARLEATKEIQQGFEGMLSKYKQEEARAEEEARLKAEARAKEKAAASSSRSSSKAAAARSRSRSKSNSRKQAAEAEASSSRRKQQERQQQKQAAAGESKEQKQKQAAKEARKASRQKQAASRRSSIYKPSCNTSPNWQR